MKTTSFTQAATFVYFTGAHVSGIWVLGKWLTNQTKAGGAGSEVWNRVYMIAPVKKFGRVGLCTNFIPNKHGGGEEGELAEIAVIWCTRVCVSSALFPLFQV